jgi:hypothetical protein
MAVLFELPPARLNAENGPLDTPTGTVRFYFHALGSGRCDLAFKFAGQNSRSLSALRRSCRAIRRIVIERLNDPGYRLHPQTATYTCLAVRYADSELTASGTVLLHTTDGGVHWAETRLP